MKRIMKYIIIVASILYLFMVQKAFAKNIAVVCDPYRGIDLIFATTIKDNDVSLRRTYEYDTFTVAVYIPDINANPMIAQITYESHGTQDKGTTRCFSEVAK